MKLQIGKDKEETKTVEPVQQKIVCKTCDHENDESSKVCRNCGEEFIVTAESINDDVGVGSTSDPLLSELPPLPSPPKEARSEVRMIADRLGLPKEIDNSACAGVIADIIEWGNQEIAICKDKQTPLLDQIEIFDTRILRARIMLKQCEVRPFEAKE